MHQRPGRLRRHVHGLVQRNDLQRHRDNDGTRPGSGPEEASGLGFLGVPPSGGQACPMDHRSGNGCWYQKLPLPMPQRKKTLHRQEYRDEIKEDLAGILFRAKQQMGN